LQPKLEREIKFADVYETMMWSFLIKALYVDLGIQGLPFKARKK
jgi:hypothetical protein